MICPRCGATHEARFYGPCEPCRLTLRQLRRNPTHKWWSGEPLSQSKEQ